MNKRLMTLLCLLLIGGCQTTRESTNSNVGTAATPVALDSFDKHKAAQIRLNAGLQYLKKGNLKAAKRHLDKALEFGADSANVHFGLAYYYQRVKEFKKAKKAYRKALRIEPKNPDLLNGYGQFLCEQKDYSEAMRYFKQAIDIPIYADVASALSNAGICSLRTEREDMADKYFRRALNRDPKMPVALFEMAKMEYKHKRYDRARSYLDRYEKNSRSTSESLWLGLRVAYFMQDKDARASYALKLEKMFPDSDETAEYLDHKDQWM